QYEYDWVSFKFHLYGRVDNGYRLKHVIKYVLTQPLVLGPATAFLLLPFAFMRKTENAFHRALKFTLAGVLIFFFMNSFRVYIHKHWTSIAIMPMLLLSYEYLLDKERWARITKVLAMVSIAVLLVLRLYLTVDILPESISKDLENLHDWETWAEELEELADERNIVFVTSYENASRYTYLTGEYTHCLSPYNFNPTHFDLWPAEDTLQGKTVFLVNGKLADSTYTTYTTEIGEEIRYRVVDNYRSYSKVWVEVEDEEVLKKSYKVGEKRRLKIKLINRHDYPVSQTVNPELAPSLVCHFMQRTHSRHFHTVLPEVPLSAGEAKEFEVTILAPEKAGTYEFRLGVQAGWLPATINSKRFTIEVEE
ncbi:MAG: hypothetical protein AAF740_13030, partial [Bacteroidota bacterium]